MLPCGGIVPNLYEQGGLTMTWTYECAKNEPLITANTKEELAQKIMEHVNAEHGGTMTMDDARQAVNQNAQQAA